MAASVVCELRAFNQALVCQATGSRATIEILGSVILGVVHVLVHR